VSDYATNLLNFDPVGSFPGAGEKGLAGIVVDPGSGDVFVSSVFAVPGVADLHFPEVRRFHSENGGRTAASQTAILQFSDEPMGASHQTSNLSIGPDGKLYVHIGDGLLTTPAQNLDSVRGKILRVHLDGSAPSDNPFYDVADGLTARDLVFAWGLRNPFGGAWRDADGALWEVENGPGTDRLAKIAAGRNYLWDGSDASMANFAVYLWSPAHAPVNIAFTQVSTSQEAVFLRRRWTAPSSPRPAPPTPLGPQGSGKRLAESRPDVAGNLGGPLPLVEYIGAGAARRGSGGGPDGLYFMTSTRTSAPLRRREAGASVFRVV
jgi:hypothetical protein